MPSIMLLLLHFVVNIFVYIEAAYCIWPFLSQSLKTNGSAGLSGQLWGKGALHVIAMKFCEP